MYKYMHFLGILILYEKIMNHDQAIINQVDYLIHNKTPTNNESHVDFIVWKRKETGTKAIQQNNFVINKKKK